MAKVEKVTQRAENHPEYLFWCPGCKSHHWFKTTGRSPKWSWNGDAESPKIFPSILVFQDDPKRRCHFFIVDGKFQYLDDCHHEFKGQTIPMVDM